MLPALIARGALSAFDNGARFSLDIGTPERLLRLTTQFGDTARALQHACAHLPCRFSYPGTLSRHQVSFFRSNGFVKLSTHVSAEHVHRLREAIHADIDARVPPIQVDSSDRVRRISAVAERAPVFLELMTSNVVLDPLESLLGPNIELVLNRHNHATVNAAGMDPARLHRDILQWSRSIVTALVYLEEASVDTGCTWVVPVSHLLPFVGTPNNGGTWMDEHSVYADLADQAVPIPMQPGSVLLLDSLAFHTVGRNVTNQTRMSVTAGYRSVDELDPDPASGRTRLVRGRRLYRGNDRAAEPM